MKKIAPLFFVLAFVIGCAGGLIRPRVERGIRDALPGYIGPAAEYRVRTEGSTSAMMRGRIAKLFIEGKDVQILPELKIAQLDVEMHDVRYKPDTRKLTSVGASKFTASVSEAGVNRYISEHRKGDSDLRVALETNEVYVEFVPRFIGLDVPVRILGRLEIVGHDKVSFRADKASVARLPIPAYAANKVLDRINPVLDLSNMAHPVLLESVRVRTNLVIIEGGLQFQPPGAGRT